MIRPPRNSPLSPPRRSPDLVLRCDTGRAPLPRKNSSRRSQPRPDSKDRKSTRLNSSHSQISYAVFCLKKKRAVAAAVVDVADVHPLERFRGGGGGDPAHPAA